MKRFLFVILFSLFTIISNGQIYNTIKYYDKFDDCVKTEKVKTLITISNQYDYSINYDISDGYNFNYIIIETKNKQPETYLILQQGIYGRKDSIVNLVNNVYGIQYDYYCVNIKDTTKLYGHYRITNIALRSLKSEHVKDSLNNIGQLEQWLDSSSRVLVNVSAYKYFNSFNWIAKLTNRFISRYEYTWQYEDQFFWIQKNDGSRIIYTNE